LPSWRSIAADAVESLRGPTVALPDRKPDQFGFAMSVAAFSVVRLRTRITKRYGEARTSTAASCSFAFIDVTWTCAPPPIGVVKRSQPDARNVELSSQRLPVRSRQPLEDDDMLAIIRLGPTAGGRQADRRSIGPEHLDPNPRPTGRRLTRTTPDQTTLRHDGSCPVRTRSD